MNRFKLLINIGDVIRLYDSNGKPMSDYSFIVSSIDTREISSPKLTSSLVYTIIYTINGTDPDTRIDLRLDRLDNMANMMMNLVKIKNKVLLTPRDCMVTINDSSSKININDLVISEEVNNGIQ